MNLNRLALLCAVLATSCWLFAGCSGDTGASSSTSSVPPNGAGTGPLIGEVAQPCVRDCEGKACGFDGCFGQCGICGTGNTCHVGQCVAYACTPNCEDRACGSDGCGGSCGTCAEGTFCLDLVGTCNLPEEPDTCLGITFEGCCNGQIAVWCDGGTLSEYDCADEPSCGWVPDLGYYCESDGGVDPSGELPKDCDFADCTPNCTGVACGDDGCGGTCGACEAGLSCELGICVMDPCMGIGPDGCCDGQISTWCENDKLVTEDCSGQGGSCGWTADSGYYCQSSGGTDPGGLPKDCGFGDPPAPDNPCAPYTDQGCCDGQTIIWCDDGEVQEWPCDSGCGWDPSIDEYDCDMDGAEEPSGAHPKDCP